METLVVLKAKEKASACFKSFKERTLTKKNARESLLLNSDFNDLLLLLLSESNQLAIKVSLEFVINCIQSKIISPTALLTLIQQKLPTSNSSKITSMPTLERISHIILEIEYATGINFAFQLANSDLRVLPYLIETILIKGNLEQSSDIVNFLLGDPDLVFTSSTFDNSFYKLSRCRLLTYLVNNVQVPENAELLITFLIWNSSRMCVFELGYLTNLIEFYGQIDKISPIHFELFEVYIEVLCNCFFKFNFSSEIIENLCKACPKCISFNSAFKLGSLILLKKDLHQKLVQAILSVLSKFKILYKFSKLCSLKIMLRYEFDEEFIGTVRNIFDSHSDDSEFVSDENSIKPFTELGMLAQLGLNGKRLKSKTYESYFDLIELSNNFDQISKLNLNEYLKKGHFELVFNFLAYHWKGENREEVVKGFLQLLGDIEGEDSESKILRYSWIVDFFEENFDDEMFLKFLPLICDHVTNIDNILFAFVQQKISHFISQKNSVSAQFSTALSLFILFESSQTRQSRLNFLTTVSLSFLHNLINENLSQVDSRAVFVIFKLICKLSESAVIDPRDVWTKYIVPLQRKEKFVAEAQIRAALFSFCSCLRVIPEDAEGNLNEIKFEGIKYLLQSLSIESDPIALNQILESLTKIQIEILKKVEIKLLQPEPIYDEEGNVKEINIEDILIKSFLFNPQLLFEISRRYPTGPGHHFKNLLTKLIDYEVETMSRTKFLGSNEKLKNASEVSVNFVSNPSFCNGLIYENFSNAEFINIDSVLKCVKSQFMPIVPSLNLWLWYVRPHLPVFLMESIDKIMQKIDDQRIKKQMSDFNFLLSNLKSGNTPQATSCLLMTVSALLKWSFVNQIISENVLFTTWISTLTRQLAEVPEFKPLLGNEEFLAAFSISCNLLSGCSNEIDEALTGALESMILSNSKIRDGLAVYCAIEALSKLNLSKVQFLLSDKLTSSKRKLVAVTALIRIGHLKFDDLVLPDKVDDVAIMTNLIASLGRNNCEKDSFVEPLEFKGISSFVKSLINPEELKTSSRARALDNGSVPAALKYDAILSYLLGSGLDLITMRFMNNSEIDFKAILNSTKDSKCHALIQLVSRSSETAENNFSTSGFERFDRFSWLKFIGSVNGDLKYEILLKCKLLPRIDWGTIDFENFDFVLKHVLSITPITNVPYINPSLLSSFFCNVKKFVKNTPPDYSNLYRIVEILYNNSDERSNQIIGELLNYFIDKNDIESLKVLLEECVKNPATLLKAFDISRFNTLKSDDISKLSKDLIIFSSHLGKNLNDICAVEIKKGNIFNILKDILTEQDNSKTILKLEVLAVNIKELEGKEKITSILGIIDLMYVHQQEEIKYEILGGLLYSILKDIESLILESKINLSDAEFVNKIRTRSSVIPKDIYERIESVFISSEFEKQSL